MGEVITLGLDIAKSVFQVHGVDHTGTVVMRKRRTRQSQSVSQGSRIGRPCPLWVTCGRRLGKVGCGHVSGLLMRGCAAGLNALRGLAVHLEARGRIDLIFASPRRSLKSGILVDRQCSMENTALN